ncbi:MAG: hypothetical protein AAF511_03940 [Pseudomonadota bacterium]
MSSALEFGSSLARAAAQASEQMTQAWEFPDKAGAEERATDVEEPASHPSTPSAIDRARQAVDHALMTRRVEAEALDGASTLSTDVAAEPMAPEPTPSSHANAGPANHNQPSQPSPRARAPKQQAPAEPKTIAQQADQLDERAQRLLSRFVAPEPDFFEKSPFEDWDAFEDPSRKPN